MIMIIKMDFFLLGSETLNMIMIINIYERGEKERKRRKERKKERKDTLFLLGST